MKKLFKIFLFFFVVFIIVGLISGIYLIRWVNSISLPDFQTFEKRKVAQTTKIYDRTGQNLLFDVYSNTKRTVISYEDIPRHLKNATVAIEDSEFYQHGGVKPLAILRALITNLESGEIRGQGGSTITQQLIKNTFLTSEKTFERKVKEAILAIKMENEFSKEQILALYLNEIPYGGSAYGIEAAAETFFGKNARDLTLAESAYLAALPQAPTYYSPYGNHKDDLDTRKDVVLKRMLELSFITEDEYKKAGEEEVKFIAPSEKGIRAPHFVMFVKSYLEDKYGKDSVEQGGLQVTTTLNLSLQEEAEALVLKYAEENEQKFNAKNAGLVATDPKTGQILVMVGSRNYFDRENEGNFNVALAKRQPGSAFKPFVYATAFKKGFTPQTVVFDLKTEFNSSCNPDGAPKPGVNPDECYQPSNYDGVFRGPIALKDALAQSVNVPAVKTLYLAGIDNSIKTAQDLGISTLKNSSRYGLTLVLGGGEVTLLEMTSAYSVFANNGVKNSVTGILKVEDSRGNILEEFSPQPQKVLEENIARQINDILSDNKARAPAFGEQSYLYFPEREVAVKTGTTNDYRDAWVIGYTPNFSMGVWIGNNDNSSMEKKVAGFIAAPLWNAFLKKVFEEIPKEDFIKDDFRPPEKIKPVLRGIWQGGNAYFIDKISQKLATEFTPSDLLEEKILLQIHCILYWLKKENPLGERPENPEKDPQFNLWETPVRIWVENQKIKEETFDDVPKETDDVHKPEYLPEINIISPKTDVLYKKTDTVVVEIEDKSRFQLEQIDLYMNDYYLGSIKSAPFKFVFEPSSLGVTGNTQNLRLIAYDKVKNKKEFTVPLSFSTVD